MQFNSITDNFFDICSFDNQLLYNKDGRRPYTVVLNLNYKGGIHKFAIPFRSNIPSYIDKSQYFSLPPRSTTQTDKVHGLHFIKMFPIKDNYLKIFISKDINHKLAKKLLITNRNLVKQQAQDYLNKYESGVRVPFYTDIEGIYRILNNLS